MNFSFFSSKTQFVIRLNIENKSFLKSSNEVPDSKNLEPVADSVRIFCIMKSQTWFDTLKATGRFIHIKVFDKGKMNHTKNTMVVFNS